MRENESLFDCLALTDGGKRASRIVLTEEKLARIDNAGGIDFTQVTFGENSQYSNNPAEQDKPTYIMDLLIPAVFNVEICLN